AGGEDPVLVATISSVTDLTQMPAPTSLMELEDGPATGWGTPEWALDQLAPNLPERGMVLGSRFTAQSLGARDDVYVLLDSRRHVIKFTVAPHTPGTLDDGLGLRIKRTVNPVELGVPVTFGPAREITVPTPVMPDGLSWLTLREEPALLTAPSASADIPPSERD